MELWAQNLEETMAYCQQNFEHDTKTAICQANRICENVFLFSDHWEMERTQIEVKFENKINWEHIAKQPENDPEWMYAMNRHTSFVNLGKAYSLTKDEKYATKFVSLISDWIDTVLLTEKSKNETWRSIEAGLRCECWLRALEFFKNSQHLTSETVLKIEKSLQKHAEYLLSAHDDFHRLSNWGVLQDHGLYLLGVYFNNTSWQQTALERLDENLHLQVMGDGSHWEQSPMYHCEVLHCAIDTIAIAWQNGFSVPQRFEENTHKMCTALAKWLTPNGRLVCQSDSDDTDARDIVAQGALLFKDGYLKFAAGEKLYVENLLDFGKSCIERYNKIVSMPPKIASTVLTDSGNYMLRSDNSQNATFLHMHCGCLGSGHGHADLLHIDVVANGENVLIDSGRYTYVNTEIRRKLKGAKAHNTTLVDGESFSQCVDSWGYSKLAVPIKGEHKFTKTADYITGSHLGYMDKGVFTTRKIVFVKPDVFIVFDGFLSSSTHSYEQYFHFGKGQLSLENNKAVWQGEKTKAQLHCVGNVETQLESMPFSTDYNLIETGDVLRVSQTANDFASFISVLSIGEEETTVQQMPVTSLRFNKTFSSNQAQGVKIVKGQKEITVLIVHEEVISEVDLMLVNGHSGYGKAIVFDDTNPQGICLAW